MNLSTITDFPSLCAEYHYFAKMISLIYYKIHYLYLHIFCLVCNLVDLNFFELHSNSNSFFLSFRGITHAYLLIMSINGFNMSIMSIKGEFIFLSLYFLIGLCNSLANYLFGIFWFLIPLSEAFFYQNIFRPLKQIYVDIYQSFLQYWVLYYIILYQQLFFYLNL